MIDPAPPMPELETPPPGSKPVGRDGRSLVAGLRRHQADLVLVALLTAVVSVAATLAGAMGWPIQRNHEFAITYGLTTGLAVFAVIALAVGFHRLLRRMATRDLETSTARPRRGVRPYHLAAVVILFVCYGVFVDAFVGFKRALPAIVPFRWDPAFMRLDALVHGGRHPWEWLQPILGHPPLTRAIDALYYSWFPVKLLTLGGFLWCRDRVLRTRFYLGYWMVWIVLGVGFAYALSSAGPCYYAAVVGGPDPYAPLMTYLHGVHAESPLFAVDIQSKLWEDYTRGTTNLLFKGISAMPSLHVAIPAFFTLAWWSVDRRLGLFGLGYTLLTVLGSIHLGWHYAIDGYLSALLVPLVWLATKPVARAYLRLWPRDG